MTDTATTFSPGRLALGFAIIAGAPAALGATIGLAFLLLTTPPSSLPGTPEPAPTATT